MLEPSGAAPAAAVLLVSGCSGFVAMNGLNVYRKRADELYRLGYAVLAVDYLGKRGAQSCAGTVTHEEVAAEIVAAARSLRSRPKIDPKRIYVIGWSFGGGGVLAALRSMPGNDPDFARAATYYPSCRGAVAWQANVKVLALLGGEDTVAPPSLCATAFRAVPADRLRAITYPGALHGFDVASLPARTTYQFGTIGYLASADAAAWQEILAHFR